MLTPVAPLTDQVRVLLWPGVIAAGFAANEAMTGGGGGGTLEPEPPPQPPQTTALRNTSATRAFVDAGAEAVFMPTSLDARPQPVCGHAVVSGDAES